MNNHQTISRNSNQTPQPEESDDKKVLNFPASGNDLTIVALAMAILSTLSVISTMTLYFLFYPLIKTPYALLYTAILSAAVGWFSYISLMTAKPIHTISDNSIIVAGWHPMSNFGEIQIPFTNICEVKKGSLFGLMKMGWFHGRVHTMSNFVEIEIRPPLSIDGYREALFKYRIPPWHKNRIAKLVITVLDREKFIQTLREKCKLP